MLEVFGEYFEKYGDIVFTRLGPLTHTIIFSNADLAKEVFRSSINLTKGPAYDFCESWLGRGLLTARGEMLHFSGVTTRWQVTHLLNLIKK